MGQSNPEANLMLLLKLPIQCCLGTFVRTSVSETCINCQMQPPSNVHTGNEGFRHRRTFCQALYLNNFHSHPPVYKERTHTLSVILWILNQFILMVWHYWPWPSIPNNRTRKKQRKDSKKFQLYEEPFVYILAATNTVNPSCWVTDLKVSKHTKHWRNNVMHRAVSVDSAFSWRAFTLQADGVLSEEATACSHQCQTSQPCV